MKQVIFNKPSDEFNRRLMPERLPALAHSKEQGPASPYAANQVQRGSSDQAIRVHWRLYQGDGQHSRKSMYESSLCAAPDLNQQIEFSRRAESLGVDSLLVDFAYNKPDPILLTSALGQHTARIKFIIACRSGLMSPTYFVQQLNTLSSVMPNRFSLNMVVGHSPAEQKAYGDFLPHDQRFSRTQEFLDICHKLWQAQSGVSYCGNYYRIEGAKLEAPLAVVDAHRPELFIAGSSAQAQYLARECGDIWISLARAPKDLAAEVKQMNLAGKQVGLRLSLICRASRDEAIAAAQGLVAEDGDSDGELVSVEKHFVRDSDSVGISRAFEAAETAQSPWQGDCLWTGAVKSHGAPAIALVGSPREVAAAIFEYHQLGVQHFIFSGWPQLQEMSIFGREVLPLVRKMELAYRDELQ